ncbi:MAG: PAS domain-containing protein [Rhizobacter sp.]|nr:PAS domain-containing protein [Burkholderiales bacterium]
MQSNVDFPQLIAALGDAVVAADAEGAIVLWNPAAERLFGYTESEALGKSLDIITPLRFQQRHWDGYHRTMATGQTKYGHDLLKVPAVHKDGRALSIAFTVAMLFTADNKVSSIVAVIRDETSRFAEERNWKKRIMELEAQGVVPATAQPDAAR